MARPKATDYKGLGIAQSVALHERAIAGDLNSTRGFVCHSLWRNIVSLPQVPADKRDELFAELTSRIEFEDSDGR